MEQGCTAHRTACRDTIKGALDFLSLQMSLQKQRPRLMPCRDERVTGTGFFFRELKTCGFFSCRNTAPRAARKKSPLSRASDPRRLCEPPKDRIGDIFECHDDVLTTALSRICPPPRAPLSHSHLPHTLSLHYCASHHRQTLRVTRCQRRHETPV